MWFDEDAENSCPEWGAEWCYGSYGGGTDEDWTAPGDDWAVNPKSPGLMVSNDIVRGARADRAADLAAAFGGVETRAVRVELVRARYGVRVLRAGDLYREIDDGRVRDLDRAKVLRTFIETVKAPVLVAARFRRYDVYGNDEEFLREALGRVYARMTERVRMTTGTRLNTAVRTRV